MIVKYPSRDCIICLPLMVCTCQTTNLNNSMNMVRQTPKCDGYQSIKVMSQMNIRELLP